MITFRRTLPTLLTLLTFGAALLLGWAIQVTSEANAHTVDVSTATMADVPAGNPCISPAGTEPCDVTTPLPDGGVFQVIVEPVDGVGLDCDPDMFPAQVVVLVVGQHVSGDVRAETYEWGCARHGDPLADFGDKLPGMYRAAAAQLDV